MAIAAQDDLEQTLARSLVNPLDPEGNEVLSGPEADALWVLAQRPRERLWLRFEGEALRNPLTASKLSNRAEPAWIAAIGLDVEERKRAEAWLFQRLDAADVSGWQLLYLATAALTLGDLAPTSSQRIANILVELLASKDKLVNHREVVRRLVEAMQQLEPGAAAGILTIAREKDPNSRYELFKGLAAVARLMEPPDAVRILSQALATNPKGDSHSLIVQGLVDVAGQMEAREAARILTVELEKEPETWERNSLARGLAAVAGRMEAREAARVPEQAAGILIRALDRETNTWSRKHLAEGLAAVAGRMEPRGSFSHLDPGTGEGDGCKCPQSAGPAASSRDQADGTPPGGAGVGTSR
jgi:hypothetical protein